MSNRVLAIKQKGAWVHVWNVDYETAVKEAEADPEYRQICSVDENENLVTYTSNSEPGP